MQQLTINQGRYTGNTTFVPGEIVEVTIEADIGDWYAATIQGPGGVPQNLRPPFQIGSSGDAIITYTVGDSAFDGYYNISMHLDNITFAGAVHFFVKGYDLMIETDREAYLVGDEVRIFWTANNIKNQTLPNYPDGVTTIDVFANDGATVSRLFHKVVAETPAGSTAFTIPATVNKDADFFIKGWHNSSLAFPIRFQSAIANFQIGDLAVTVDLDKPQYTIDSLLSITVKTVVRINQTVQFSEPGCTASIKIYKETDLVNEVENIGVLTTNSRGNLEHIYKFNLSKFQNTSYVVRVVAFKWDETYGTDSDDYPFLISEFPSISIVLDLDKEEYTSAETLQLNVTAVATGTGQTASFTYIYEVRDTNESGNLFARETKTVNQFTYKILDDFVGTLWIHVTVDDGQGNREDKTKEIEVDYAIVLVNLDKVNFLSGETIEISYQVVSTQMTNPYIFYIVKDAEESVVKEGAVGAGQETDSFEFVVPSPPSGMYEFTVIAIEDGIRAEGKAIASLFTGYVLLLEFNRNTYAPGDTMAIDYEIIALGESQIPNTFTITYGLRNGPRITYQTQSPTGRLLYLIPNDIDEGDQLFWATSDIGGEVNEVMVNEVIVVQGNANPFWHSEIFDMPFIIFFMLLVMLILIAMVLRQRRVINEVRYQKMVDVSKKVVETPKVAATGTHATISCVSCENPIEIMTSRRPIEVMCPHCGEIQRIEE